MGMSREGCIVYEASEIGVTAATTAGMSVYDVLTGVLIGTA